MGSYGIPYQGSKQIIADEITKIFPSRTNFYDLFGGGFSITHSMLMNRRSSFKNFYYNEIESDVVDLVKKAVNGDFNYQKFKPEFISRKNFHALKDTDAYIRCLWSFGNNQKTYLFGPQIEPYKKSMHNAFVFNVFDDLAKLVLGCEIFIANTSIPQRRLLLRNRIEYYRKTKIPEFLLPFLKEKILEKLGPGQLERLERLDQLKKLEELEGLERLQTLEGLERLQTLELLKDIPKLYFSSKSYEEVPLKEDSIIYCDIPYLGTAGYLAKFDHKKFLNWAHSCDQPVFISEYNISDKRFKLIKQIKKLVQLVPCEFRKTAQEKIYVNEVGYRLLLSLRAF